MDKKIMNACENLKNEIYSLESVKEFLKYKDLIKHDETLLMMKKKYIELVKTNPIEAEKIKKAYDSNPIVSNYNSLKEEVFSLLTEISEIINENSKG